MWEWGDCECFFCLQEREEDEEWRDWSALVEWQARPSIEGADLLTDEECDALWAELSATRT